MVTKIEVSVVLPVLDEVESLGVLHRELTEALQRLGRSYEIILVDDGSRDGSFQRVEKPRLEDPRVRGVQLRRNFGKSAALAVGFREAQGDVVVTLAPGSAPALLRSHARETGDACGLPFGNRSSHLGVRREMPGPQPGRTRQSAGGSLSFSPLGSRSAPGASLYHPDEPRIVEQAVRFHQGDLNPRFFNWPSLYMYVMAGVYGLVFGASSGGVAGAFARDPALFYLVGRLVTALFGTATVASITSATTARATPSFGRAGASTRSAGWRASPTSTTR